MTKEEKNFDLIHMGVRRNFSGGGQSWHFAYHSQVFDDAMQWTYRTLFAFLHHKENAQCYGSNCIQYFPPKKILH